MKVKSKVIATAVASLIASHLTEAASFSLTGTLHSSDNTSLPEAPLIVVTSIPFYSFKSIDNGMGVLTAFEGFTSLAGVDPSDVTFAFGDLELTSMFHSGSIGTQIYGNTDGGPRFFDIFVNGVKVATGNDMSLTMETETDPLSPNFTLSTGFGLVTLQEVGGHPLVSDIIALQGNSVLRIDISSFVAPVLVYLNRSISNSNDYTIGGGGVVVPEPSAAGLLAFGAGILAWRRRRD